jgi:carbon catabolite-derepressing protein kinase
MTEAVHSPEASESAEPISSFDRERHGSASGTQTDTRTHVSTIAILPSSLPEYHTAYMKGRPKPASGAAEQSAEKVEEEPQEQSSEQQAENLRRLRPHSRSTQNPNMNVGTPESLTPIPAKKSRPTKWQFGIRSRNAPSEAMLAIYKALSAMGAEWEKPTPRKPPGRRSSHGSPNGHHHRSGSQSRSSSSSASGSLGRQAQPYDEFWASATESDEENPAESLKNGQNDEGKQKPKGADGQVRRRKHYGPHNDWGYEVPEDPWVIHARFKKEGMYAPGVMHPNSAHSSRVDLNEELSMRKANNPGSTGTLTASEAEAQATSWSRDAKNPASSDDKGKAKAEEQQPQPDEALYVYMTIQLYCIEKDFFLVDFKCDGYERLVKKVVNECQRVGNDRAEAKAAKAKAGVGGQEASEAAGKGKGRAAKVEVGNQVNRDQWYTLEDGEEEVTEEQEYITTTREELVGVGRATGEKTVTSPFPFLDVASKLIIPLAEGD